VTEGSTEAFAVFYVRHIRPLLGFFMCRTGDPEIAADLASETFAAAFAGATTYRVRGAESMLPGFRGMPEPR
jgi:RNA polymerase sigma-70 factor (ECF subfamily)